MRLVIGNSFMFGSGSAGFWSCSCLQVDSESVRGGRKQRFLLALKDEYNILILTYLAAILPF